MLIVLLVLFISQSNKAAARPPQIDLFDNYYFLLPLGIAFLLPQTEAREIFIEYSVSASVILKISIKAQGVFQL